MKKLRKNITKNTGDFEYSSKQKIIKINLLLIYASVAQQVERMSESFGASASSQNLIKKKVPGEAVIYLQKP